MNQKQYPPRCGVGDYVYCQERENAGNSIDRCDKGERVGRTPPLLTWTAGVVGSRRDSFAVGTATEPRLSTSSSLLCHTVKRSAMIVFTVTRCRGDWGTDVNKAPFLLSGI